MLGNLAVYHEERGEYQAAQAYAASRSPWNPGTKKPTVPDTRTGF